MIGWQLTDASGFTEYFTIGRSRGRFHRPDVIDRILQLTDEARAVAMADEVTLRAIASITPGAPQTRSEPPLVGPSLQLPTPLPLPPPPRPEDSVKAPPVEVTRSLPSDTPGSPGSALPPLNRLLPPTLVYKHARTIKVEADSVTLEFGAVPRENEGLSSLIVRRDGILQPVRELRLPPSFDGRTSGTVRFEVPRGESIIHIVAQNRNGYSDPLTFVVQRGEQQFTPLAPAPSPAATGPGRLYLLAIGVAKYADARIPALDYSAKDARDFAALLQSQTGRAYANVEARVLTDRSATRDAIKNALQWFAAAVQPGDTGIVFLAGHAVNHPNGSCYFFSHDTQPVNVAGSAVDEASIRTALVRLRGRAVLFVDTCHAGNVVGNAQGFSRDMSRITNDLASPENGVIVFASSTGRQESVEDSAWGNGAFTRAVVSGMRGGADLLRQGRVTFQGLGYYVSAEVSRLTNGEQTPVLIAPPPGIPDFTLALLTNERRVSSPLVWWAQLPVNAALSSPFQMTTNLRALASPH